VYIVFLTEKAKKQMKRLPSREQERIRKALPALGEDPWKGKKMEGDLSGCYALRVWPYRIIYTIERQIVTVTVVAIGHRKDVYEKLRR